MTAMDVAKYILWYEHSQKRLVTNLRLQKLLYFVQGHFGFKLEKPCFDEILMTKEDGPFVPSVNNFFKKYNLAVLPDSYDCSTIDFPEQEKQEIQKILDMCSEFPTYELIYISQHQNF